MLAYFLQYTDASWEQACEAVKSARSRARTKHNTFVKELLELAKEPKIRRADHTAVQIRDGGNDPCDDKR